VPGLPLAQPEFLELWDHQAAEAAGDRAIVRNKAAFFHYHLAFSFSIQM
jgi:hypothetical protein